MKQPTYLIIVLPPPTMLFIKVSFFILYLQLFHPMRWLRICAYIGAVFTALFYIAMTVALFISSTPRHGETWQEHAPQEQLLIKPLVAQSAVGLAIDLSILLLPTIAVSRLHLPPRQKIGVMLIFMTGLMYAKFRRLFNIDLTD